MAASVQKLLVARNPDEESKLPFLVRLPVERGLVLRAREPYPTTTRVFCYDAGDPWPDDAELVQEVAIRSCLRRGVAIELILDRSRMNRSQFIFTKLKNGRPAIFWQTPKTTRATKPGARVPTRRASGQTDLTIVKDQRERYGYRFGGKQVQVETGMLACGDYAVLDPDGTSLAAVERKTIENLSHDLIDGSLRFAMAELATLGRAVIAIEGGYGDLLDLKHAPVGFILDLLARLQVQYPEVPLVFCGSRKMAEEYTYRFLGAARAEIGDGD